MPAEEVAKLRNVAVVGQGGTGKTSVADALLFAAGAATRIGRVDDASSAFDAEPEEQRRKSTITAALHHVTWKKHEINLIDTPGYSAFLHDTHNCLGAATGVVLVLGSTGGEVKVESEKVWSWCQELGLPAIGFVTRLDRERALLEHALEDLKLLGVKPAVLQVPIGVEAEFPASSTCFRPRWSTRGLGHVPGSRRAGAGRRGARRASGWWKRSRRRRRAPREVPRGGAEAEELRPASEYWAASSARPLRRRRVIGPIRCSTRSSTSRRRRRAPPWKATTRRPASRSSAPRIGAPFSAYVFKTSSTRSPASSP
jgi:signal recognition particle receptor subunit beta